MHLVLSVPNLVFVLVILCREPPLPSPPGPPSSPADDCGATEATVVECRILLAQSPDLYHLSPGDISGLHLGLHHHLFEESSSA